jgi:hypothetical protein
MEWPRHSILPAQLAISGLALADEEAALDRIEMDVAVLVDEEDDDGFSDGIVVGTNGDLAADTLDGFRPVYLLQCFLQASRGKTDFGRENDVAGLQHGERGVIGEHDVVASTGVAVLTGGVCAVRVEGSSVVSKERGFLPGQVQHIPFIWIGESGEAQVVEACAGADGIVQLIESVAAHDGQSRELAGGRQV